MFCKVGILQFSLKINNFFATCMMLFSSVLCYCIVGSRMYINVYTELTFIVKLMSDMSGNGKLNQVF